jgi:hypothetical protein
VAGDHGAGRKNATAGIPANSGIMHILHHRLDEDACPYFMYPHLTGCDYQGTNNEGHSNSKEGWVKESRQRRHPDSASPFEHGTNTPGGQQCFEGLALAI